MGLFNRYSVSILDKDWKTIIPLIKIKHIPRSGEFIYLEDKKYYKVVFVVHHILKKHGIFIIVEVLDGDPQKSM